MTDEESKDGEKEPSRSRLVAFFPLSRTRGGKAKQKNVKFAGAEPKEKSKEVNGRIYLDLTSLIKADSKDDPEKQPKRPNWRIIVDEKTGYKVSHLYATKDGMVEPTCILFKQWKEQNKEVQVIRMDNGGENKALV